MPRPTISLDYQNRIFEMAALRLHAPTITANLRDMAEERNWEDPPTERTVRKYVQQWERGSPEDREAYEPFKWPESMGAAGLPWEASRVSLDLLRSWPERNFRMSERPTVDMLRWYWRVHQAAPDAPEEDWYWGAANLLIYGDNQSDLGRSMVRALESYLAFAPWRWPYDANHYMDYASSLAALCLVNGVGYDWPHNTEPEPVLMDRLDRFLWVVRMVRNLPQERDRDGSLLEWPEEPWLSNSQRREAKGFQVVDRPTFFFENLRSRNMGGGE